jgi:methionyl-tRNA formyltransferase
MKLIVFADSGSFISNILLEKLLSKLRHRFELLFVVDANKRPNIAKNKYSILGKEFIKKVFNKDYKIRYEWYFTQTIYDICKKYNIRCIVPQNYNINDESFIETVKSYDPDFGLAIGCPQIFREKLLGSFKYYVVNYHNSLLPKYRGLYATAWSIYFGEEITGFSYHIVNEKIDDGNILIQDYIKVDQNLPVLEHEVLKTFKASEQLERLIDLMECKNTGYPQVGEPSYYGSKELKEITTITDPTLLTSDELKKRIYCFSVLNIKLMNNFYPITKFFISSDFNKKFKFYFRSSDGIYFYPIRFNYLPKWLYDFYKLTKIWRKND